MARKRSKANYFTRETEEAIIRYNNCTDLEERAQIFTDEIYYPFYKLAENIIHTFKFYYTDVDNLEDLKHEIVTVLLEEKIDKFDPTNGAKAFSYFGTIVKRWLINYNNKNYKQLKKRGTFEEFDDYKVVLPDLEESRAISLGEFIDDYVDYVYGELDELFDRQPERQIADAVLTIFKTRHDLDIFKKKALYIYIREITDCQTPHLTKVIKILREEFYQKYEELNERGLIVR